MSTDHKRNPKTVAQKERREAARDRRAQEKRRRAMRERLLRWGGIAAVVLIVGGGFAYLVLDSRPAGPPSGVVDTDETSRNHVDGEVEYAVNPPAGGDHNPTWQNCGFYDEPIANENAVHSLEHGAVWIQYAQDLPDAQVQRIRELADGDAYVLASPFEELDSPVVLSAWGKQLTLDSIDDERVDGFLESFLRGPQTPEPGAACSGGTGDPVA